MRSELGTNVIPIFARSLLFIPKAGIKQLVRVINTPEAYAIYLELWEYAEGFAELEAERDQMKADLAAIRTELKRVNDERESLLSERDELAAAAESLARGFEELSALHRELTANSQHTQAKLNAAIHFIEHKPGPRACRYRIAEIEFVGVNIFEGPQFRLATRKLKLEEMNPEQRNVHAIQKGSISAQGTIKSTRRRLQAMGTSNADLLSKVQNWERAGEDFLNTLMPTTMEFSGFAN
jgi:Skp family chaperone for outer membrane proteins